MKKIHSILSVASLTLGLAVCGVSSASAGIVCNDEGDCWHTKKVFDYPSEAHIVSHDDNWKWRGGDHFDWREHEGRGFWRHHNWTDF